MLYTSTFQTTLGPFSIAIDETGALVATAFGDAKALKSRCSKDAVFVPDETRTRTAREQVSDYLAGRRHEFDLRLEPQGSEFQRRVWSALCAIPRGQTRSYGAVAKALKSSPRAVGRANATNPICLIVPCHRVVGADGSLTGFAFGEPTKRSLLALEGVAGF